MFSVSLYLTLKNWFGAPKPVLHYRQDEQDLRVDYEVTADSMEQIEAKQYPCDECEYNVK